MKTRLKLKVRFDTAARPVSPNPERVPRVARLLALAYYIDEKIRAGDIENWSMAARDLSVTRARMTQIANLLLLPPSAQEAILFSQVSGRVGERQFRLVLVETPWPLQTFYNRQVAKEQE